MRGAGDDPSDTIERLIRLGTVASVDLPGGRCTVKAGDVETGPVRWIAMHAGATRSWSPPSVGEQVVLMAPGGEIGGAVALRGIFSDANPAPGDSLTESMVFMDGATFTYDPEAHHLSALLPGGGTIELQADGGVTIRGDVVVQGTITASEDVIADGVSLKTHKHGGVQAGSAQTGAPA